MFKIHSQCSLHQLFTAFYGWMTIHRTYVSRFFIHSTVNEHLGGFTLVATVNAAVTIRNTHCKNICFSLFCYFFGDISSIGISGSCGNSLFNFSEESSHHFPQCLHHLTVPPATHRDPVSPVLTNSCYILLFFKNTHTKEFLAVQGLELFTLWWGN